MAESVPVQIADALVAGLLAATFSLQVEPKRVYNPSFDRAKAGELKVSVVPVGEAHELADRNSTMHEYAIKIDVRKAIDPQQPEETDLLLKLTEEIKDYLRKLSLATTPAANWKRTENEPLYDEDELAENHQFQTEIIATFTSKRGV